jgi:hypothetical protein
MFNNALIERWRGAVHADTDWGTGGYGLIWNAIIDLEDQGSPADLSAVYTLLKERGQDRECGGAANLARMLDECPCNWSGGVCLVDGPQWCMDGESQTKCPTT